MSKHKFTEHAFEISVLSLSVAFSIFTIIRNTTLEIATSILRLSLVWKFRSAFQPFSFTFMYLQPENSFLLWPQNSTYLELRTWAGQIQDDQLIKYLGQRLHTDIRRIDCSNRPLRGQKTAWSL